MVEKSQTTEYCMFNIDEHRIFSSEHGDFMTIYFDCNATTPMDPEVFEVMHTFFLEEYGNPGSRTHEYGNRAKKSVEAARREIANTLDLKVGDRVIFTSGATESNNQAFFGLENYARKSQKNRIIISEIEHKAVLEPAIELEKRGFEVVRLKCNSGGQVDLNYLQDAVNDKTLLVSIMHVNNETCVVQPISEICEILQNNAAFFHTDSAQGFGKESMLLKNPRIDMISISGHKIYGPKGVGALILRRRGFEKIPLTPLIFGGGQEDGYRSGTLAVPLIVGLGKAATIAFRDHDIREARCKEIQKRVLEFIDRVGGIINGDPANMLSSGINFSIPNVDSEAAMLALKDVVAVSNGSACTSQSYNPSHVLLSMGLDEKRLKGALRFSWSHLTPDVDWDFAFTQLKKLL